MEKLDLVSFLTKESEPRRRRMILCAASISGIANGVMVMIINSVAEDFSALNVRYLLMFAVCVVLFMMTKNYSLNGTARIVRNAMGKSHVRITDKARNAGLLDFERIGRNEIFGTLTENAEIIYEASRLLAGSASSAVMVVFSFLYIAYLSTFAFWIAILLLTLAIVNYLVKQNAISEDLDLCSRMESELFGSLNHLLAGFKEIKMNRAKSDDIFHNYFSRHLASTKSQKLKTESLLIANQISAQTYIYLLIAAIVFLLPRLSSTSPDIVMNITSVILFMIGPLGVVVEALPMVAKANVSIRKIDHLERILEAAGDAGKTQAADPFARRPRFGRILLRDAFFEYRNNEGGRAFSVGPLNLHVEEGEILFITGGNGSGKTTMIKLLTGMYYPAGGTMYLDEERLSAENYAYYRDFFSIILTDFHIFDRLYGIERPDAGRVGRLLAEMELTRKTAFRDHRFTNTNLSTGQRKRLALIVSFMDDKPICVFDEVAADQDLHFRKYFYEVMLGKLKAEGKTIIAITHDDRYFHVSDRVIRMEYGKIVSEKKGADYIEA